MSTDLQKTTSASATAAAARELRPGTRIYFQGDSSELAERVRLSAGTRPVADGDTDQAVRYTNDAYVPCPPWRRASAAEHELLHMDGAAAPANGREWRASVDAAVVRISDDLISPLTAMLEQRGLREAYDETTYQTIASDPNWQKNLAAVGKYLAKLSHERPSSPVFHITEPDRLTVTQGEDARFVGLHLDSWNRLPLRHRNRSQNRICINLGRGARYSLFLNLPLMDMFTCIGLHDPEDIYEDFRGVYVGARFMRGLPDYPVIRLRIDPGEAYLLPTDNLVHDASTEGNVYPDITLHCLGLFFPNRLAG